MSLQSRLATLISAIGTDIKEHDARMDGMLAIPQLFLRGGITYPVAAGNGIYWITSEQDVAIQPNVDSNRMPVTREGAPSKFDVVPGYKPQMRLRSVLGVNQTDPGTQVYSIGVTNIITIPGAGAAAGGSNNRKFSIIGTYLINQRTNVAAATRYEDEGGWQDHTDAMITAGGLTGTRLGVYMHASATNATGAFLTCEWEIEIRWVPE